GTPSRWHVSRAAITLSGEQHARSESGPSGSSQSRSVTPTASGSERRSATALSTPPLIATATRVGDGAARNAGPSAFASASTASVSPPTAAASSSVRPARSRSTPGASASTIRPPSTRRRTDAHSPPRLESPKSSCIRATVKEKPDPGDLAELCDPGLPGGCPAFGGAAAVGTRAPFHVALDLHVRPVRAHGVEPEESTGSYSGWGAITRIPSSCSASSGY